MISTCSAYAYAMAAGCLSSPSLCASELCDVLFFSKIETLYSSGGARISSAQSSRGDRSTPIQYDFFGLPLEISYNTAASSQGNRDGGMEFLLVLGRLQPVF